MEPGSAGDLRARALTLGTPQQNAGGTSIAAAGLGAWSNIVAAQGVQSADNYKASALEAAAQRGKVSAAQTGGDLTRKLSNDLANIDAVRAAAHADPTSPTGAAIRDWSETLGLTNKRIAVDNIIAQSNQEMADAAFLRSAGRTALFGGELGAGASLLSSISKAMMPIPGS